MENEDDSDGLDGNESNTCANCRFFREIMIDQDGQCRRFAPQPSRMRFGPRRSRDDDYHPEWPTVSVFDWCGDFEIHPLKVKASWE